MSTRSMQQSTRPTLTAPFIALLLVVALLAVGAQVSSMWGPRINAPVQPASTVFLPTSGTTSVAAPHLPRGCRPKVGC
jgi:hypothetical protein